MTIYPNIEINKTWKYFDKLDGVILLTHFNCKNFKADNPFDKSVCSKCSRCRNWYECDISNPLFVSTFGNHRLCPRCRLVMIDILYWYLMYKLKEFIPKDFKHLCCYCSAAKEKGIKDWSAKIKRNEVSIGWSGT